jgi:predicted nucleotidyltransferase component of viral defense system
MLLPELKDFFLVGGTSLALQLGHRISIDIDLFTQNDFDTKKLFSKLNKQFEISDLIEDTNTLNFNILFPEKSDNIIKIDLIKYSYPLINPIFEIDKIRLLSVEDIIPMKLSAVAGRGSKKDFYDIFHLLKSYSLDKMFVLFKKKFPNTNEFHILKSLTYFEDAEIEPNPQMTEKTDWNIVKTKITKETNRYINK